MPDESSRPSSSPQIKEGDLVHNEDPDKIGIYVDGEWVPYKEWKARDQAQADRDDLEASSL